MEEWKDIEGYEGIYQVNSDGRVKSLDRIISGYHTNNFHARGRIIKPTICVNGYAEVHLCRNGKRKVFLIHRLVAKHFIPNPDNLPEVNHKDENPKNNAAYNLEWCTSKYNANYGTRNARCYEGNRKYFKPVWQIDRATGKKIKKWECIKDASRTLKIRDEQISRVCKGKNKSAGGFIWEYC